MYTRVLIKMELQLTASITGLSMRRFEPCILRDIWNMRIRLVNLALFNKPCSHLILHRGTWVCFSWFLCTQTLCPSDVFSELQMASQFIFVSIYSTACSPSQLSLLVPQWALHEIKHFWHLWCDANHQMYSSLVKHGAGVHCIECFAK